MQVVVGRELEARCAFALSVELDQLTCDVFDLALGLVLQSVPSAAAEGAELGLGAVLAAVFGDAVERVDAHVKQVAIVVYQADGLLLFAIVVNGLQTVEASDAVVDVRDIVAGLQLVEVFQRDSLLG